MMYFAYNVVHMSLMAVIRDDACVLGNACHIALLTASVALIVAMQAHTNRNVLKPYGPLNSGQFSSFV